MISCILIVFILLCSFSANFSVSAAEQIADDNMIWNNPFDGSVAMSVSSGDKNVNGRLNKIINTTMSLADDSEIAGGKAAMFLCDNLQGTSVKKAIVQKNYLGFENEAYLTFKIKIASPVSGDAADLKISYGNELLSFKYDSDREKYAFAAGDKKYFVSADQWISVNAFFAVGTEESIEKKYANAACRLDIRGNAIYNQQGEKINKIIENTDFGFDYNEASWSNSYPVFLISHEVCKNSKAAFYLAQCKLWQPGDFYVKSISAPKYENDLNTDLNGSVTVVFNHEIDADTYDESLVDLIDQNGEAAVCEKVFKPAKANMIVFDFSKTAMQKYCTYTLRLDSSIKDIYGKSVNFGGKSYSVESMGAPGEKPTPMPVSEAPEGGYIMPDMYNTGYLSEFESLVNIEEKYPEIASNRYTVTDNIARKYNYVFEGFKSTKCISVKTDGVTVRDFYINSTDYGALSFSGKNNVVCDGEIEGSLSSALTGDGYHAMRLKIHDVGADHMKGGSNVCIESCYIYDGGTDNPTAHADGIQFSGYSNATKILGCRFDMPSLPGKHVANACIFLSPDFDEVRNVQASYNWLNGGGHCVYLVQKENLPSANITFTNNLFGIGKRWAYLRKLDDIENLAVENNLELNTEKLLQAGSVLYTAADGKRTKSIEQLAGKEITVGVNFANYTDEQRNFEIDVSVIKNGKVLDSAVLNDSVKRYITPNEYLTDDNLTAYTYEENGEKKIAQTLINFPDLPRDVLKSVSGITIPEDVSNCRVEVSVYNVNGSEKTLIRKDVLKSKQPSASLEFDSENRAVKVYNAEKECVLIMASYDSSAKIKDIRLKNIGAPQSVGFDDMNLCFDNADAVKVMLLKDTNSAEPLCEALEINVKDIITKMPEGVEDFGEV